MKKRTIVAFAFHRRPISNLCVYFDFFFFTVTLDDRVLCELALSLIELALTLFVNEFQPLDAIILKRVTVNFDKVLNLSLFCFCIPVMNFMISLNEKKIKPECQKT